MMTYRVITQSVEINGKVYRPGETLDASAFRPGDPTREALDPDEDPNFELGELKSLLKTRHIEPVNE